MKRLLLILILLSSRLLAQETSTTLGACSDSVTLSKVRQIAQQRLSVISTNRYQSTSLSAGVTRKVFTALVDFSDGVAPTGILNRPLGWLVPDVDSMLYSYNYWFGVTRHFASDTLYGSLRNYADSVSGGRLLLTGKVLNSHNVNSAYNWMRAKYLKASYSLNFPFGPSGLNQEVIAYFDSIGVLDDTYTEFIIITSVPLPSMGIAAGLMTEVEYPTGRTMYGAYIAGYRPHIGVYAHELVGHAINGFVDEYNVNGGTDPLNYCLMSNGCFNAPASRAYDGSCPAPPNPMDRIHAGWIAPIILASTSTGITLSYNYYNPLVYIAPLNANNSFHNFYVGAVNGQRDSNVYVLLENKGRSGFDRYLPSSGQEGQLLVWRSSLADNVRVISPTGTFLNTGADFFPKSGVNDFTILKDSSATVLMTFTDVVDNGATTSIASVSVPLSPFTLITEPATNIQTTSAKLNGIVNINATSTGIGFIIGTSRNLPGSDTVLAYQTPATEYIFFDRNVYNLTPNTKYYVWSLACNVNGSFVANIDSFTTQSVITKPSVQTVAPSGVTHNSFIENGLVNPNGGTTTVFTRIGSVSGVLLIKDTITINLTGTTQQQVQKAIPGYGVSTNFFYKVFASNIAGIDSGGEVGGTTLPAPATPPTVTTNAVSNIDSSRGRWNATINPNGSPTTVFVDYDTVRGLYRNSIQIASIPSGISPVSVSGFVGGLLHNYKYYGRTRGQNGAGTTIGLDTSFTTLPAKPWLSGLSVTNISQVDATIRVNANAGGILTTIKFYRGLSLGVYDSVGVTTLLGQTLTLKTFTTTGLSASISYYIKVTISNSAGLVADSMVFQTSPPTTDLPIITTGTASNIQTFSADLSGMADPNNLNTTITFFYYSIGQTDTVFTTPFVISGAKSVPINISVSALIDSHGYYFNILGRNALGFAYGARSFFQTDPIITRRKMNARRN